MRLCFLVHANIISNDNVFTNDFACHVQVQTDISVDTKQQTLQGVAFPLHGDAVAALERYRDKKLNYVQLVSAGEEAISAPSIT